MSHQTDAGGERNLKEESEVIKSSVLKGSEYSPTKSRVNVQFTSLAQAKIPNFSAYKILGRNIIVQYVPDFFYPLSLTQKMFNLAKLDKTLKRVDTLTMYSFTLYICYAMMYVLLDTIAQTNPDPLLDYSVVLEIFKSAGFETLDFPVCLSEWLTGIGKHIDPNIFRQFVPTLGPLSQNGDYFDNHFYGANTGHLLPNFKLMMLMILHRAKNTPIVIPQANKPLAQFLGNPLSTIAIFQNTILMRRKSYRVPGIKALMTSYEDPELVDLVRHNVLNPNTADPLQRYLMLDRNLLTHLKSAVEPLFQHIDIFKIKNTSSIGNSLTMIPLISNAFQEEIISGSNTPVDPQNPNVECIFDNEPEHAARVKSRFEVINGNIDVAVQTPIVRIALSLIHI